MTFQYFPCVGNGITGMSSSQLTKSLHDFSDRSGFSTMIFFPETMVDGDSTWLTTSDERPGIPLDPGAEVVGGSNSGQHHWYTIFQVGHGRTTGKSWGDFHGTVTTVCGIWSSISWEILSQTNHEKTYGISRTAMPQVAQHSSSVFWTDGSFRQLYHISPQMSQTMVISCYIMQSKRRMVFETNSAGVRPRNSAPVPQVGPSTLYSSSPQRMAAIASWFTMIVRVLHGKSWKYVKTYFHERSEFPCELVSRYI